MTPIVELRQYTLHPGRRDVLVELFDREFVHTQEAVGIRVIGQFRDADATDRFVWLRGFEAMDQRAKALSDFYFGPVWKAHREAANATMIDSDDVLLLRPVDDGSGFAAAKAAAPGVIAAAVHPFDATIDAKLRAAAAGAGIRVLARYQTLHAENTFPALPVRQDENVYVWFARFDTLAQVEALAPVLDRLPAAVQRLRLIPTAGSALC